MGRLSIIVLAVAAGACATRTAPAPRSASPAAASAHSQAPKREPTLHCPDGMALLHRLQGPYCIDRWEASLVRVLANGKQEFWPNNRGIDAAAGELFAVSVPGRKPQGYISGVQAELVCHRAGKRLCEIDEWVRACRGARGRVYPYGNERRPGLCNDRFRKLDQHPVVTLFRKHAAPGTDPKLMWHPSFMNDPRLHDLPRSVANAGSLPSCTNETGVFDMVGNLHEWVSDPEGSFFGGFFMDTFQNGEGCDYRTVAHPIDYHDYSTGFRCCAEAVASAS